MRGRLGNVSSILEPAKEFFSCWLIKAMSDYPKVNYYDWLWKLCLLLEAMSRWSATWLDLLQYVWKIPENFINEVFFLCRSLLQPDMDLKWVISEEERTRHDALFYSQRPQDRYLSGTRWNNEFYRNFFDMAVLTLSYANIFNVSGEQARSLFIRSKLPLPELSKIWFVLIYFGYFTLVLSRN